VLSETLQDRRNRVCKGHRLSSCVATSGRYGDRGPNLLNTHQHIAPNYVGSCSHNIRVLLEVSKHLLSQRVGDLRIHAGVPDIPVPQVIGNILYTAAGFKQVYGNGVAQSVYVSHCEAGRVRVGGEEVLNLSLLHCALPSRKQVWGNIPAHPQISTQQFCGVSPQWFLSADAILESANPERWFFKSMSSTVSAAASSTLRP
jgi:hypothetical protein